MEKNKNPSPKCPKFAKILKLQILYRVSCTKIEMFLVLTYKKFNTIFKCLFRNKMFSCLHLCDSLHRSQICLLFLAELFTFTSSSQKIIPCKIRAALLQKPPNTHMKGEFTTIFHNNCKSHCSPIPQSVTPHRT